MWQLSNIAITFILVYTSLIAAFDVSENNGVITLYISPSFLTGILVFISAAGFVRFLRLTNWIPKSWTNDRYMDVWFLVFVVVVVGLIQFFKYSWSSSGNR